MLYINDRAGAFVAMISKQSKAAPGYISQTPWLLLHNNGKVRRFGSMAEARDEAQKHYAGCSFSRKA